jgi:hypothetical protein
VQIRGPLPGALLIADRGNDRILLVDPRHKPLWSFPTRADRAKGRQLVFDDDTFVQPGGKALVTNEEDHGDILSIDIKTHRVTRLFGVPGPQAGPGASAGPSNRLNWPDDAYVLPNGTLIVADAYRCRRNPTPLGRPLGRSGQHRRRLARDPSSRRHRRRRPLLPGQLDLLRVSLEHYHPTAPQLGVVQGLRGRPMTQFLKAPANACQCRGCGVRSPRRISDT